MKGQHTFYPMLNRTIKAMISVLDKERYSFGILRLLLTYPNHLLSAEEEKDPVFIEIIRELDRQYTRWNKGVGNGNA